MIPQYYGVHWGVYPANIIQQSGPSGQARRPLSPSQPSEVTSQSNGNLAASAAAAAAGNMQGPLSQYQVTRQDQVTSTKYTPDQTVPKLKCARPMLYIPGLFWGRALYTLDIF